MKPFTLEWWMEKQREAIVDAEFSWGQYVQNRNLISERVNFIDRWELAHWITDRIINKYGE